MGWTVTYFSFVARICQDRTVKRIFRTNFSCIRKADSIRRRWSRLNVSRGSRFSTSLLFQRDGFAIRSRFPRLRNVSNNGREIF